MRYSLSASDDSCYPYTTVLINKLGLQEQGVLNDAEYMSVSIAKCDTDFLMTATMYAAQGVIDYLEDFFRSSVDFGTKQ